MNTQPLTKREQAAVLKAAEMIASGACLYSCAAIGITTLYRSNLALRYARFFEQGIGLWPELTQNDEATRGLRVLLLLLFLGANK